MRARAVDGDRDEREVLGEREEAVGADVPCLAPKPSLARMTRLVSSSCSA